MYYKRTYRNLFENELVMFDICVGQTDLKIGCDKDISNVALKGVRKVRTIIWNHITRYPEFEKTLEPIETNNSYPNIINRMIVAGIAAGTGPMAAVAGVISQYVGEYLLKYSSQVFIENGGDIYFASDKDRTVGIYTGKSVLSDKIAIIIKKEQFPLGICTSSGTVGHSFSMGNADAVTVISPDTALADAVATAAGNIIKSEKDIKKALEFAMNIKGITGIIAIIGDKIGATGEIELAPVANQR